MEPSSARVRVKYVGRSEGTNIVVLEFPEEKEGDPNLSWLRGSKKRVEWFCEERCFKIGTLYVLPDPYIPVLDRFLREADTHYRSKGYTPIFRIMHTNFSETEYASLRHLILNHVFSKLEKNLEAFDRESSSKHHTSIRVVQKASKDLVKAKEAVLLFQLEKSFPKRMDRIHDLINILSERIAECQALAMPVVVTRING